MSSTSTSTSTSTSKETNIEVCVRIRPLVVDTSGTPFFSTTTTTTSSSTTITNKLSQSLSNKRVVNVKPWATTSSSPRFISRLQPPPSRTTPLKLPPKSSSTEKLEAETAHSHNAWNIVDDTTVRQSETHTEHIQGRTEHYTLDRVYGTTSTSKELYANSVKPVVESAMEGYHASVFA
jgi:hypothetical protein